MRWVIYDNLTLALMLIVYCNPIDLYDKGFIHKAADLWFYLKL